MLPFSEIAIGIETTEEEFTAIAFKVAVAGEVEDE
jgi:hypothetical protein